MKTIPYADTTEIDDIARKLSILANDLDVEFNSFFQRMSEVPRITQEWVGGKAEIYFKITETEKPQYKKLTNKIRAISRELNRESSELEDAIIKNNKG